MHMLQSVFLYPTLLVRIQVTDLRACRVKISLFVFQKVHIPTVLAACHLAVGLFITLSLHSSSCLSCMSWTTNHMLGSPVEHAVVGFRSLKE
jgi:hypothetical protein